MKNAARTIQIFLPDGDPTGIRSAEVTTSVLRVIDIPRSQLNKFFLKSEASQVGIYFLIGEKEDTDEKLAYIGQSQDLKTRVNQHSDKEFWNRVIIVVSLTNKLLFLKDHLFNTPSGASSTLIGYSSNGWVDWKNESGCTLDEIKRLE